MKRRFHIVDVFAERKYAGNPLAVILDGAGLSTSEMQAITREMNYSETTFLLAEEPQAGGYDVRIFTPAEEIPFAGHPTLGTAWLIQQEIIGKPVKQVLLNYPVGQVPVEFLYEGGTPQELWMHQPSPSFGASFTPAEVAPVLGLQEEQIIPTFPCREVSTGLPFLIVPLKDLAAVKAAKADTEALLVLLEKTEAKNILIFAPETYRPENDLNARVFTDYLGIPEDPATGSAAGCLAAYLAKYGYFGTSSLQIRVEQGYEIGRPSLLLLQADALETGILVRVGGQVIPVASGQLI